MASNSHPETLPLEADLAKFPRSGTDSAGRGPEGGLTVQRRNLDFFRERCGILEGSTVGKRHKTTKHALEIFS